LDFPYFHNIRNLSVETRLEGDKDSQWEDLKANRKYILDNIPPGDYILKIRYLMSGNNKYAYKKIFISIKPFFYQTVVFKVFIVLLGITLIFLLIYIRTNKLKALNRKLTTKLRTRDNELEMTANKLKNETQYQQKIIKSITHDITAPVKFIAKLSHEIAISEDSEKQRKYFDSIYKTSEELFTFTQNLKEYTKLFQESFIFDDEEYSLYSLVESKKLLFDQIAINNNTAIINDCNPDLMVKINKNILSTILHNLIDNAVKFTNDGEILIGHHIKNDIIEIYIRDTGTGMSKYQIIYYSDIFDSTEAESFVFKNYELGLHMVIQLIKKLSSKIIFHENTPKGTIVKIFLKKEL
jgi:K+-sensing histidine kinase KdpD